MKNIEKEKKLNLIIITDTHGEIDTEILDIFADGISEEIDALVCLGDVTDSDLDKIKNHTSFKNVDRKFGILGNHDWRIPLPTR